MESKLQKPGPRPLIVCADPTLWRCSGLEVQVSEVVASAVGGRQSTTADK